MVMDIDHLHLYRGDPYPIASHIALNVPTINDILSYGERDFYTMAFSLTEKPGDLKWQLWEMGIDWTTLQPYDLFCDFIAPTLTNARTKILFGDILDFSRMRKIYDEKIGSYKLVQNVADFATAEDSTKAHHEESILKSLFKKPKIPTEYTIVIDKAVYSFIVQLIRHIYGFSENKDNPANEITKLAQIEDDKEYYNLHKNDPYESRLFNYISTMVNSPGFKHDEKTVFDMNIYAFMNSVKRIIKIKNADLLLSSGYSGFGISLKDINKEELDWTGRL